MRAKVEALRTRADMLLAAAVKAMSWLGELQRVTLATLIGFCP
jgi:hypothetical protein